MLHVLLFVLADVALVLKMKLSMVSTTVLFMASVVTATIWQNDQVRITNYPDTKIDLDSYTLASFPPSSPELSYKGRWDSKYVSWWSAPGLKFGFTGEQVAITFGPLTSDTVLVAYRVNGQDWQFTNITTSATHLLVSSESPAIDVPWPINPSTFELRVTNWAYGVQISAVHLSQGQSLIKIPNYSRSIEFIGDSLSSGYTATLEGLSSFTYGMGAGLGNTEYSITAYPGICLYDQLCFGNTRGMFHQWYYTSDTSPRAAQIWGDKPELWDFSKQDDPDFVVINLGTNDSNGANNVSSAHYVAQYKLLIEGIHAVWPNAQVIIMSLWEGFFAYGNSYAQAQGFTTEIYDIYQYFNSKEYLSNPILYNPHTNSTYSSNKTSSPFVSYFNTTGLMQHNDIGPAYHPTDVGHVKIASHLIQYVRLKFGWELYATGPEVFHDTLYWNDNQSY